MTIFHRFRSEVAQRIKAIETHWKGYRFRSRLEARWAVFFDAVGLRWEYEIEGFDLGELGWYLPDFMMLHNAGRGPYVEIKPVAPTKNEIEKLDALCCWARGGSGAYGAFIWGAPGNHEWMGFDKEGGRNYEEDFSFLIEYLGHYGMSGEESHKRTHHGIVAARSARFEHGEKPRVLS